MVSRTYTTDRPKRRSKPQSPLKCIASFLGSPFRRKHSMSKNEKAQPLLKCYSYEQIANATNEFHQDNLVGRGGYSEVYKDDLCLSMFIKLYVINSNYSIREDEFDDLDDSNEYLKEYE
ncbi:putative receptor-like serine/threonine-protein kinase [Arachis hypogaea]|nr:putative receptor-like serine/threonine-protein kinase [Arachis hypogaea]QHO53780.1 putative receptor-like serine/threonine-protein kinase [Arachis hypogaea]